MKSLLKKKWIYLIAITILFCIYIVSSVWSSENQLTVNFYNYKSDKQLAAPIRLVVLADLHDHEFGMANEELVSEVENQQPDIILLAGDILNDISENSDIACSLVEALCEIAPVYYTMGNHEIAFEEMHPELVEVLAAAGATVLDKEYVDVDVNGVSFRIGGLYDYAFYIRNEKDLPSDREKVKEFLLEFEDTDAVKIMMSHRPDSFIFGGASDDWDIDLVVSGHLHGGQVVVPFLGGVYGGDQGYFPDYVHGMYEKDGMNIFVTSGLGTNPKIVPRINNLPEIAVININ